MDFKEAHDGQYGVRHYRKVIETAAKYQIAIDNHELLCLPVLNVPGPTL